MSCPFSCLSHPRPLWTSCQLESGCSPAHLPSLIGRLILPVCELGHLQEAAAEMPQSYKTRVGPVALWLQTSTFATNQTNIEWHEFWMIWGEYESKVTRRQWVIPWASLFPPKWKVEMSPAHWSLLRTEGATGVTCVCCVCSGRAARGHHALCDTRHKRR